MSRRTIEHEKQESAREREMRALVRAAERSGVSRAEFARRHGVPAGTLSWWSFELRRRDRERAAAQPAPRAAKPGKASAAVRWLRVDVRPPPPTDSPLELVLGAGRVLRMPRDLGAKEVAALCPARQVMSGRPT